MAEKIGLIYLITLGARFQKVNCHVINYMMQIIQLLSSCH